MFQVISTIVQRHILNEYRNAFHFVGSGLLFLPVTYSISNLFNKIPQYMHKTVFVNIVVLVIYLAMWCWNVVDNY